MPIVTYSTTVAASLSDVQVTTANGQYNAGSNLYNVSYLDVGNHWDAGYRPCPGLIFQLPSALSSVDPDDITDVWVEFKLQSAHSGAFPEGNALPVKLVSSAPTNGTWPATRSPSESPATRYSGATEITAISWTSANSASTKASGTWAVDTVVRTPNLAAHLQWGMTNAGITGGSYITVVIAGQSGANNNFRAGAWDDSSRRPVLKITANVPAQDASVTTTAPGVAVATGPHAATTLLHSSYHDGIGSSASRAATIHAPLGQPPATGWPVVVWLHGGAWATGSRADVINRPLASEAASRGWAVVSVDYKLTGWVANQPLADNSRSHPHATQDVICALGWLATRTELNAKKVVLVGESAGGTIALEAALTYRDNNSYTWSYTAAAWPTDPNPREISAPDTAPSFTYTQGRDLADDVKVIGVLLFDSPVDIDHFHAAYPGFSAQFRSATSAYGGGTTSNGAADGSGDSFNLTATQGELRVMDLMVGGESLNYGGTRYSNGSIYANRAHRPDFTIGYVAGEEKDSDLFCSVLEANRVVGRNSGVVPLIANVDDIGFPKQVASAPSRDGGNVATTTGTFSPTTLSHGLTVWRYLPWDEWLNAHEIVYSFFNRDQLIAWIDKTDASPYVSAAAAALTVPSPSVSTAPTVNVAASAVEVTVAVALPAPAAAATELTVPTPTVSTEIEAATSAAVVAARVGVPAPVPGAVSISVPTPDAATETTITASAAAVIVAVALPAPAAAHAALTVPTPSVSTASGVEVTASAAAVIVAVASPAPLSAHAALTVPSPSVSAAAAVTTSAAHAALTVPTPSVSTGADATVTASAVEVTVAVPTAAASGSATVAPPASMVAVTVAAVTLAGVPVLLVPIVRVRCVAQDSTVTTG